MTLWAIVPVKPLRRGKSRLAGVLTPEERAELNSYLLAHTLDTLTHTKNIGEILVVSRDPQALALARQHGARTVAEHGTPQLNIALTRATAIARTYSAHSILVVPADLPLITPEDIDRILALAKDPPVVVIAPDRHKEGTNALLVSPSGLIQYGFGTGSFERHCERARQAGARLEICDLHAFGLDVDLPEDLDLVSAELDEFNFSAGEGFYV